MTNTRPELFSFTNCINEESYVIMLDKHRENGNDCFYNTFLQILCEPGPDAGYYQ